MHAGDVVAACLSPELVQHAVLCPGFRRRPLNVYAAPSHGAPVNSFFFFLMLRPPPNPPLFPPPPLSRLAGRLRDRPPAPHAGGARPPGEQPAPLGFYPRPLEQDRERHAGPVAARDEAVNPACGLLRRL